MHLSRSFHLLGSHQGQEVPSLQSHQETPEHTKKQDSHVTRGGSEYSHGQNTHFDVEFIDIAHGLSVKLSHQTQGINKVKSILFI